MGMKEASEMAAIGDMDRGGMTEDDRLRAGVTKSS